MLSAANGPPALQFSFWKRTFWVTNLGIPPTLPMGGSWKKGCCKARKSKTPGEGEAHAGDLPVAAGGRTALRQGLSPSVSTTVKPSGLDASLPGLWSGIVLHPPRPLLRVQQATHPDQPKAPPVV